MEIEDLGCGQMGVGRWVWVKEILDCCQGESPKKTTDSPFN
jgi:hypothetical protein